MLKSSMVCLVWFKSDFASKEMVQFHKRTKIFFKGGRDIENNVTF